MNLITSRKKHPVVKRWKPSTEIGWPRRDDIQSNIRSVATQKNVRKPSSTVLPANVYTTTVCTIARNTKDIATLTDTVNIVGTTLLGLKPKNRNPTSHINGPE